MIDEILIRNRFQFERIESDFHNAEVIVVLLSLLGIKTHS